MSSTLRQRDEATVHGAQEVRTKVVKGLVVTHFRFIVSQNFPRVYVRQNIPVDKEEIPRPEVAQEQTQSSEASHIPP